MITAEAIEEVRLCIDNAINSIEGHMNRLIADQSDMPANDKATMELKKATDAFSTTMTKLREGVLGLELAKSEKEKIK